MSLTKLLKNDLAIVLLLLVLGALVYSFTLKGEFLHMDDVEGIVLNPQIKDFSQAVRSNDLKTIVNGFIYKDAGENTVPYHLVSIFLHVINSILVFYIAKALLSRKAAVIATLLFLAHPAGSEAVSWISGSVYLYQALFWLSSIYLYILFKRTSRLLYLVPSVLIYALYFILVGGVWGVVLPFVILTLDIFVISKTYDLKKFWPILPYAAVTCLYLILNFTRDYSLRSDDLEYYYVGLTAENRFVSMLRAIVRSAKLMVFPYRLDILFGNFDRSALSYLGLFLSVSVIGYVFYYLFRKNKIYFGIAACIYVAVLPIFSPVSIGLGYAERYFYFSSVFFSLLAALFLFEWRKGLKRKDIFLPVFFLLLSLLLLRTFLRTLDWRSDETIWKASLAVESKNNYKAYNELGNIYYRNNDLREALVNYDKALQIRPSYPEVLHNVGLVYIKAGQMDNAKVFLVKSLQLNPKMYQSYYRLGQVFAYEGATDQAEAFFVKALEINPNFAPAQLELQKLR